MDRATLVTILLWYNVLSLAVWAGGTVYQMAVVVPLWSGSPDSMRAFFRGTEYLKTIRSFFGPKTQIARALPLFVLTAVAWPYANVRPWIVVCASAMLVGLVMTRAYIYPMNDLLFVNLGAGLDDDRIRAKMRTWIAADRVRFAIMTVGYVCLLRAFSMPLEK